MPRKTHLVGAWPGYSAAQAIDTAFTRLGPHLLRLSDGETDERAGWIQPLIDRLRGNADLEVVEDGGYTDYDDSVIFAVRKGHEFRPEELRLGYYNSFADSYPDFRVLRERHGFPDVAFQVGLPGPLDMAGNVFGFEAIQKDQTFFETYTAATAREATQIFNEAKADDGTSDVIFQIETVFATVGVAHAPKEAQAAVADKMAAGFAQLASAVPEGARFGVHVCLGDFHHKAFTSMADARPIVELVNALVRNWPAGRSLEYIHVPFAAAGAPGSLDPAFYEPLGDLEIPDDLRFVAGFVHESLGIDDLRKQMQLIEAAVGGEVDIAATCGLGRRDDPNEAWDAMDKTVTLIGD